ncbi:MAG: phosphate acyltransferase PlsX [Methylacidiphilales bacterium]|nr:phosphate acyltransferase PlsX [Candidatus Methylacidiphilales bacterium]
MTKKYVLAIDLMSGDYGIEVSIPATIQLVNSCTDKNLAFLLIGDKKSYNLYAKELSNISQIEYVFAEEIITMEEEPSKAIRKKDSSMRVMIELIKEGRADGGLSAGNTGALMMLSHLLIKPIQGIIRTAICAPFPTLYGKTWVLDLGANVVCEPINLYQFAIMSHALVSATDFTESPSISLLNVGSESHKGSPLVQETSKLLEKSLLNYKGFIEGDTIFTNKSDIVITDGFTGNSVLKACEGLARYLIHETKREVSKNIMLKIFGLMALPMLLKLKNKYDPSNYNGASFLGLNKIIIKSHGSTNIKGFKNAIQIAIQQIKADLPNQIEQKIKYYNN